MKRLILKWLGITEIERQLKEQDKHIVALMDRDMELNERIHIVAEELDKVKDIVVLLDRSLNLSGQQLDIVTEKVYPQLNGEVRRNQ